MQDKPVALVTGANRGIGFQIAKDLAAHGFTVLVGSRNLEHGGRAAASIEGDARVLQLDVTDQASIDAAAERIRHELGRLDVLVNNAGFMNAGRLSLTLSSDPANPRRARFGTYAVSKAALNALTVAFAADLESVGIKVNSADPGVTATGLNNFLGTRSVEQAAREPVCLALLDASGPTGTFSNEDGPIPW
jgi:NAD(P)-dependent dehydrogenase (short-subunit alcohol dehydrogenase family)